jgi:hypothetical protein
VADGDRQPLAPALAPSREDLPTVTGSHTRSEPVGSLPTLVVGLISALHDKTPSMDAGPPTRQGKEDRRGPLQAITDKPSPAPGREGRGSITAGVTSVKPKNGCTTSATDVTPRRAVVRQAPTPAGPALGTGWIRVHPVLCTTLANPLAKPTCAIENAESRFTAGEYGAGTDPPWELCKDLRPIAPSQGGLPGVNPHIRPPARSANPNDFRVFWGAAICVLATRM